MKLQPPITDDDIEALLSGHLSAARRRVVENHLADNPDLRAQVEALRADQEALRALGAELLDEPLPDRFLRLLSEDDGAGRRDDTGQDDDGAVEDMLLDAMRPRRRLGT